VFAEKERSLSPLLAPLEVGTKELLADNEKFLTGQAAGLSNGVKTLAYPIIGVPDDAPVKKERRMTKGLGDILKQAQQMHAKISQLQEEMAGKTVEASSGGGMVNIVMNGKQEILSVRIDPEVVNREDIDMLQDLIAAAVNEAIRKSQEMMTEEMKKITGGLSIPGLL
jgi:DNA-binding YbaB/EbfC family protein